MKIPMKTPIREVSFKPADNGGFISKTEHEPPPQKKGGPYVDYEDRVKTNVHPDVQSAAAHMVQAFGGGKKKGPAKPAAKRPSAAAVIGNKMLGGLDKDSDGY